MMSPNGEPDNLVPKLHCQPCPAQPAKPDVKTGSAIFYFFSDRAHPCLPRWHELRRSMEREIIGIWGTFRQSSCSSTIPIMRIFWAWESSVVLRWVALIMYNVHIYVMYLPLLKRPVLEVPGMTMKYEQTEMLGKYSKTQSLVKWVQTYLCICMLRIVKFVLIYIPVIVYIFLSLP